MGDRPTIYDVAREAGVAASTVSRAYARPGRVNAETAAPIFAAAERIGYRIEPRSPGSLGRQTGAVALMVSDITNPFYGEIIKGAAGGGPAGGLRAAALRHLRDRPGRARGRGAHAGPRSRASCWPARG